MDKDPAKKLSEITCIYCKGTDLQLRALNVTSLEYFPTLREGKIASTNPNYFIQDVFCNSCRVVFQQKM